MNTIERGTTTETAMRRGKILPTLDSGLWKGARRLYHTHCQYRGLHGGKENLAAAHRVCVVYASNHIAATGRLLTRWYPVGTSVQHALNNLVGSPRRGIWTKDRLLHGVYRETFDEDQDHVPRAEYRRTLR